MGKVEEALELMGRLFFGVRQGPAKRPLAAAALPIEGVRCDNLGLPFLWLLVDCDRTSFVL
jgi:hypothetical protein